MEAPIRRTTRCVLCGALAYHWRGWVVRRTPGFSERILAGWCGSWCRERGLPPRRREAGAWTEALGAVEIARSDLEPVSAPPGGGWPADDVRLLYYAGGW